MEDIRRCNSMVDFSKFIYNKKMDKMDKRVNE